MYDDGKQQLDNILKLVKTCPEALQKSCFEILLKGYVNSKLPALANVPGAAITQNPATTIAPLAQPPDPGTGVPEQISTRFLSMAKRCGLDQTKFAGLFDFTVEPFAYHALNVPGKSKAQKTRNVALLIAAKAYLMSGHWKADWPEVKSMCVDQDCYDRSNMQTNLTHELINSADAEAGIALSSKGKAAAEKLLLLLTGSEGAD